MKRTVSFGHLLMFVGLLIVDLVSKYFIYNQGRLNDFSWIEPILNTGISFSIAVPFVVLSIVTTLALGLFSRLYYTNSFSRIGLLLLIAGTLGNFVDRLLYGGVRDFIVMPGMFIYNIADVLLSVAVVWIVVGAYCLKSQKSS